MALFSKKLGIDLGTANTLVFAPGKGIILNEPSVVAVSEQDNKILAVGVEAKNMIGRTPGDIIAYRPMKDERKSRRALNFPPFSTFIKVSYTGKRPLAEAAISEVKKLAEPYEVMMFPALVATVRNQYIMHALISLSTGLWPESKLLAALRSLSPAYAVNVNPESIL